MTTKAHLRSLKRGQQVWAIVQESIAQNEVIINFSGDLIRVQNQTQKPFRVGQRVLLKVESLQPLQFRLVTRTHSEMSNSLDVTI
jgi:hypothetical protein